MPANNDDIFVRNTMITFINFPSTTCVGSSYPLTGGIDITREALVNQAQFYYPLERAGNTTCDYSGNRRTASISLSAGGSDNTGVIGYGCKFQHDDTMSYYNPSNTPIITAGFTVSGFVKTNLWPSGGSFAVSITLWNSFGDGSEPYNLTYPLYEFGFNELGNPSVNFSDKISSNIYSFTGIISGTSISDNNYHHVAWTCSASAQQQVNCYIDAVHVGTINVSANTGDGDGYVQGLYHYTFPPIDRIWYFESLYGDQSVQQGSAPPVWQDELGLWAWEMNSTQIASLTGHSS